MMFPGPRATLPGLAVLALLLTGCAAHRPAFYPIGLYGVSDPKDLAVARAAGFNLVTGPATRSFLDAAQAEGLRVLATPGTRAGPGFDAAKAREVVRGLDRHPALWAWYLVDEPDFNGVPPRDVIHAQRVVRAAGAAAPTALTLYQGYETLDYGGITDLLLVDRYPIPWLPLANFGQHVRMARLRLGPDRPLFAVLQAFDWSFYPDVLSEPGPLRPPTYEELRCMAYSALAERADGLFFYTFAARGWRIREHAETWAALQAVVAEVRRRQPLFAASPVWWRRDQRFGDRSRRFNAALLASVQACLLAVRHGTPEVPSGAYLLSVNTTPETHTHSSRLPWLADGSVPVLEEHRTVPVRRGWVEDEFAPFAVHVYGPFPAEPPGVGK